MNRVGGAESHNLKLAGLLGSGRDDASGEEGSGENSLDLHGDWWSGVVVGVD